MLRQLYKGRRATWQSSAHAPPATWLVERPREPVVRAQQNAEGPKADPPVDTSASGQATATVQPNMLTDTVVAAPETTPAASNAGPSAPLTTHDPNTQPQLVSPVLDPQVQHLMEMGFRQGFLQADMLSMPEVPNSTQGAPPPCINKVRSLLQDFSTSLDTTRLLVVDAFAEYATPPVPQPLFLHPTASPTQDQLALYQDFRLCALVLSILHDTETALTHHCSNPSARLNRTLVLRYASTFITAEYIFGWYHAFRTDGRDRFDMQLYLSRMSKLLWARLALGPTLFHQRRWVELFPPDGPGKEPEMRAGAGWDLCMAVRLDLLKILAEYSVSNVMHHTPAHLVSLMEVGKPCSETLQQWLFRGHVHS